MWGIIFMLILLLAFVVWRWAIQKTFQDIIQETEEDNARFEAEYLRRNQGVYQEKQPSSPPPLRIPADLWPPDKLIIEQDTDSEFPKVWIFDYYAKYKIRMIGKEQSFLGITDFWKAIKRKKASLLHTQTI